MGFRGRGRRGAPPPVPPFAGFEGKRTRQTRSSLSKLPRNRWPRPRNLGVSISSTLAPTDAEQPCPSPRDGRRIVRRCTPVRQPENHRPDVPDRFLEIRGSAGLLSEVAACVEQHVRDCVSHLARRVEGRERGSDRRPRNSAYGITRFTARANENDCLETTRQVPRLLASTICPWSFGWSSERDESPTLARLAPLRSNSANSYHRRPQPGHVLTDLERTDKMPRRSEPCADADRVESVQAPARLGPRAAPARRRHEFKLELSGSRSHARARSHILVSDAVTRQGVVELDLRDVLGSRAGRSVKWLAMVGFRGVAHDRNAQAWTGFDGAKCDTSATRR